MIIGGVLYDSNVFKNLLFNFNRNCDYTEKWRLKRQVNTMAPKEKDNAVYKTTNWFGKKMVRVAGGAVEVKGLENVPKDKPVLVVVITKVIWISLFY